MIVPSIDIMNGKAVQLRQGKDHVLTSDRDPIELAKEFNRFGPVGVIDLDAAMGKGDNIELIKQICKVAEARVGGGIRDIDRAKILLRAGAERLIIGTSATPEFLGQLPKEKVMVALDHRQGEVVDRGWTHGTGEALFDRAQRLADYCGSFLCTFVQEEGTMQGLPLDEALTLKNSLPHPVTVAGGVATTEEAANLARHGLDVQVGMALYTGQLSLPLTIVQSLDFEKVPQIPTIVQDEAGQVLMLAYSTPESLEIALEAGKGIYYSRSRQELWEKGASSGHTQKLLSCRTDCDRDSLLFTVRQLGPACHTNAYSCFGSGVKTQKFSIPALFELLKSRKALMPEGSFTTKLLSDRKFLHRKIMEEAFEVCTAESNEDLTWEIADVLYFMSVLAVDEDVSWADVVSELGGRHR